MSQCPACEAKRRHSDDEWKQFHPFKGHGFTKETGFTHPDLKAEAEAKKEGK